MSVFTIEKKAGRARAGVLHTAHGVIETPAFSARCTKATVKAVTPQQLREVGAQVILANTYHLLLQPGEDIVKEAGGLSKFMNWDGPTMTDSGGFQVFSLGAAFGTGVSKLAHENTVEPENLYTQKGKLATITEEEVSFQSPLDGKVHTLSPERSMAIQHALGADIIFAFDECTSPTAPYDYQRQAMDRTHRWALRSLTEHTKDPRHQLLFGIVQGGRHEDLRRESARSIGNMDFDGFGIGGSFTKEDIDTAVGWVTCELPQEKPRHLLGIGEPSDLFGAIENGIDLFDCVAPTRMARNGSLYTREGRIAITNAAYTRDFSPLDLHCECIVCQYYTRAYLSHLFRAKEMLGATLASLHNLYFIIELVSRMRKEILEGDLPTFRASFLKNYYRT